MYVGMFVVHVVVQNSETLDGLKIILPLLSDHIINYREDPSFLDSKLKAVRNAPAELKN